MSIRARGIYKRFESETKKCWNKFFNSINDLELPVKTCSRQAWAIRVSNIFPAKDRKATLFKYS